MIKEKKHFALLIVAIIALFLFYASIPFLAGISGAAILYVMFKPLYFKLLRKTKNTNISAAVVILVSFVLIVLPISYIAYLSIVEFGYILSNVVKIEDAIGPFASSFGYDQSELAKLVGEHISDIAGAASQIALGIMEGITSITLNVVIMYLILFFAFTENERATRALKTIIPFSEKNSGLLMRRFTHAINTTLIGNGAASIVIGVLLAIGMVVLGSGHFFFWALIGTIMAFIPIIGIQIIWIPAGIYYLLNGDYIAGAGILVWGAFLSYIFDGLVRQQIQKKVGEMHPLISLIGLIIGITYFGVVGIIVGPLILTVFVLMAQMFRDEYVPGWE